MSLDSGANLDGYLGDLCRMAVMGEPTQLQRDILAEVLDHESKSLNLYRELLGLVEGHSVMLEEYARTKILEEETHLAEVNKMLRQPGDITAYAD